MLALPSVVADQQEAVPASLGRLAVDREIHDGMIDDLRMHGAGCQALAAAAFLRLQILRDAGAALHALLVEDERRVVGEQLRHLAPQAELRVLRVGALQILDRAHRLGAIDVTSQLVERLTARTPRQNHARSQGQNERHRAGA